jgi:homopolymeric O-antigen transport system permease protein
MVAQTGTAARASRIVADPPRQRMLAPVREVFAFNEVLQELVKRDLKVRYKRSVLGLLWTMLNPLLMMVITTIVFSNLFRGSIENFPIYMLSGYVVWAFFSQATTSASSSILDSAALARKIYLPVALFPLASVAGALINLLLSLLPLALLVVLTGGRFTPALLFLPISLVIISLFSYGLGLILAAASVFFRDTLYTYQVLLIAWMYLTPIFYPAEIIPAQWAGLVAMNPIAHFVELVRDPIYGGTLPQADTVLISIAWAAGAMVLGWWYFQSCRDRFVSYL